MKNRIDRVFFTRLFFCAIVSLLAACQSLPSLFEQPTVRLQTLRVLPASGLSLPLQLELAVTNPNPYSLTVGSLDYRLTVEGFELANGANSESIVLAAGKEHTITLPVNVNLLSGLELLASSMQSPRTQLNYQLAVTLFAERPKLGKITVSHGDRISLTR